MSYFQINNKWYEQKWAVQCNKLYDIGPRYRLNIMCQGAEGHEGPCWYYDHSGKLYLYQDKKQFCYNPRQHGWVSPDKLYQNYYLHNGEQIEVTDQATIQELNLKHYKLLEDHTNE